MGLADDHFEIEWIDGHREPRHPPNPEYPKGIDLDLSLGAAMACTVQLPYPAKRCGMYLVTCTDCHHLTAISTAGRPDDPRSVKLACKLWPPRPRSSRGCWRR
jgi:hypothetical protein